MKYRKIKIFRNLRFDCNKLQSIYCSRKTGVLNDQWRPKFYHSHNPGVHATVTISRQQKQIFWKCFGRFSRQSVMGPNTIVWPIVFNGEGDRADRYEIKREFSWPIWNFLNTSFLLFWSQNSEWLTLITKTQFWKRPREWFTILTSQLQWFRLTARASEESAWVFFEINLNQMANSDDSTVSRLVAVPTFNSTEQGICTRWAQKYVGNIHLHWVNTQAWLSFDNGRDRNIPWSGATPLIGEIQDQAPLGWSFGLSRIKIVIWPRPHHSLRSSASRLRDRWGSDRRFST